MKKTSPVLVATLFLLNATIFFGDFLPYNTWLKVVVIFGLAFNLSIQAHASLVIERNIIYFILFNILLIVNLAMGGEATFIFSFWINTAILLFMVSTPGIASLQYKILFVCSGIHTAASVFVWLLPVNVTNIVFRQLLGSGYSINYEWRVNQQMNAGITLQPGTNAIYLLCFLFACFAAYMVKTKHRKRYLLGCFLAFLMIITTGKRSALLFSPIAVVITLFIFCDKKITIKKLLNKITLLVIIIAVGFILFTQTTIFNTVRNKIDLLLLSDNLSNGRFDLWAMAWDAFKEQPLLGIGLKSIYARTGLDAHNTYLQILAETGFITFIVFCLALVSMVAVSLKRTLWMWRNTDKSSTQVVLYGAAMIIFMLLYGLVGNIFIDYVPLAIYIVLFAMVNESYRAQKQNPT